MHAKIQTVTVFPGSANDLLVRPGSLGTPPSFYWQLRNVSVDQNEKEVVTVMKDGNLSMTKQQWDSWSEATDDESYMLECVAENLGLTIVLTE